MSDFVYHFKVCYGMFTKVENIFHYISCVSFIDANDANIPLPTKYDTGYQGVQYDFSCATAMEI